MKINIPWQMLRNKLQVNYISIVYTISVRYLLRYLLTTSETRGITWKKALDVILYQ